jgi:Holliday junction DNA helicase RuvA
MIARISGLLEAIERDTAVVATEGGLAYEVILSPFAAARLADAVGRTVTLHTLHFIEAPSQGSTMHPRLAGFLSVSDRQFFTLLTTCRGIGPRKALRAMALDAARIAAAIADRDLALLQSLPEIDKRTAETLAADLHGKVDRFVAATSFPADPTASKSDDPATGKSPSPAARQRAREAMEVLLQLGENRLQAAAWIDQALAETDAPATTQALVTRVYQIKTGQ